MNIAAKGKLSICGRATIGASYVGTGRSITADADYTLARNWAESASPREHDAVAKFAAAISTARTVEGGSLLCFRGQRRFAADYAPTALEMGPPPVGRAPANRYNEAGHSVLYLCQSEAGLIAEPINGDGSLWIQRFSLPLDRLLVADFSSLDQDDFLSKVFWFAELAGNADVGFTFRFSQLVASIVSQRFDGMLVPGVRGQKDCHYSNVVLFRPVKWKSWLETDGKPHTLA